MVLRGLIVNTKNRISSFKEWHDAVWFYQWIRADAQNAHLVLLAFIPVVPKNVPLQHPDDYTWIKLEERFSTALQSSPQLGRILFTMETSEAQIQKLMRGAIYSKEVSPPLPTNKEEQGPRSILRKLGTPFRNITTRMNLYQLVISTYNVRSLGQEITGVQKRSELRDFLAKANLQPMLVLLQEHHFGLSDCLTETQQLDFRGGISLWNNALYTASGNRFKCGTGMIMGKQLAPLMREKQVVVEGRVQFAIFDTGDLRIGVLNIYAYNHTAARVQLWTRLANYDFPPAHWIVEGDFNMIEVEDDCSDNYLETAMGNKEQDAWNLFALSLGIGDSIYMDEFRKVGNKRFSWSRQRPTPQWSRLDYFYVNPDL
jgi:exonuclease III